MRETREYFVDWRRTLASRIITRANVDQLHQIYSLRDSFSEAEASALADGRIAGATVKFSPDSNAVASLGFDTSLHVFDVGTRNKLYSQYATRPTHVGKNHAISFHPREPIVVADYEGNITHVNYLTGQTQTFEHATSGKEDWSQAFTSDGQLWACQKHDRSVLVYDFATATELHVFNGHTSTICGLLFSPNNELLATAGHYISAGRIDETVRLWDIQSGEQRHILRPGPQYMPMAITFSPDSKLLAVSYFVDTIGEIYLFDVQTGQKTQILKGHSRPVHYLKFSHDGTHLATASWDDSFRLWNTATGQEVHRWNHQEDLKGFFVGLMCNSDETLLISGIRERGMVFLNPDSGQIESSIPVPDLLHFDLSSDGQLLATGGWESIQLWQV